MNKKGFIRLIIWIIILFFVLSGIVIFINLKDKIVGTLKESDENEGYSDDVNENIEDEERIVGAEEIDYRPDEEPSGDLLNGNNLTK